MTDRIRPIHDFGPAVGEYVPGDRTDIRVTFARARERQLAAEDARIPAWLRAHAPEENVDLERARSAIDADDRR